MPLASTRVSVWTSASDSFVQGVTVEFGSRSIELLILPIRVGPSAVQRAGDEILDEVVLERRNVRIGLIVRVSPADLQLFGISELKDPHTTAMVVSRPSPRCAGTASAADGCRRAWHRTSRGRCRPPPRRRSTPQPRVAPAS
ncbi:GCG_CRPN prefix-to-repeats domain-containing protein [Agromyces soli]